MGELIFDNLCQISSVSFSQNYESTVGRKFLLKVITSQKLGQAFSYKLRKESILKTKKCTKMCFKTYLLNQLRYEHLHKNL